MFHKKSLLDVLKVSSLVIIAHLYISICAFAYTRLETNQYDLKENVDQFLMQLKNGQFSNEDVNDVLRKYKEIRHKERLWHQKEWFSSYPKTFVFVLAAHTTLGNRHMNVKTLNGQLFYVLTVPLGVLLYYFMIHLVASRLVTILKNACMLVWRKEDEEMSDTERDLFVRLKLCYTALLTTLTTLLLLGTISVAFERPFITEIMYILDVIYTISSSENFIFYDFAHDGVNASMTALVYFVLIALAYTTSSSIISLFWYHKCDDILAYFFGKRIYKYVQTDHDSMPKGGVYDDYRPISMSEPPELKDLPNLLENNMNWTNKDQQNSK